MHSAIRSAVIAAFALVAAGIGGQVHAQKADAQKKMGFFVTSAGAGSAQVGHHDRVGLDARASMLSWNHAHPSRGCSRDNHRSTGGNGFFFCFAVK